MKRQYNVLIGERTAEEIKFEIASAWPMLEEVDVEIRGRDLLTGLPRTMTLESEEIREAVEEPLAAIIAAVKATLEQTPPELASDLMEYGIVLTGGGALLKGLDERLRHETGMPVHVSDSALTNVVDGSAQALEEIDALEEGAAGHLSLGVRFHEDTARRKNRPPLRTPRRARARRPRAHHAVVPRGRDGSGASRSDRRPRRHRARSARSARPLTTPVRSVGRWTSNFIASRSETATLRKQNAELRTRVAELEEARIENARLRGADQR